MAFAPPPTTEELQRVLQNFVTHARHAELIDLRDSLVRSLGGDPDNAAQRYRRSAYEGEGNKVYEFAMETFFAEGVLAMAQDGRHLALKSALRAARVLPPDTYASSHVSAHGYAPCGWVLVSVCHQRSVP